MNREAHHVAHALEVVADGLTSLEATHEASVPDAFFDEELSDAVRVVPVVAVLAVLGLQRLDRLDILEPPNPLLDRAHPIILGH